MREPIWLDRLVIDAVHVDQLRQHGGRRGIRDEDAIESALARPRHRRTYEEGCDLADLAAAYGYALARSHGFVDGNKRVSFMTVYVFLGLNSRELQAAEPEVVTVINDVAAGRLNESEFSAWVRVRSVPFRFR